MSPFAVFFFFNSSFFPSASLSEQFFNLINTFSHFLLCPMSLVCVCYFLLSLKVFIGIKVTFSKSFECWCALSPSPTLFVLLFPPQSLPLLVSLVPSFALLLTRHWFMSPFLLVKMLLCHLWWMLSCMLDVLISSSAMTEYPHPAHFSYKQCNPPCHLSNIYNIFFAVKMLLTPPHQWNSLPICPSRAPLMNHWY